MFSPVTLSAHLTHINFQDTTPQQLVTMAGGTVGGKPAIDSLSYQELKSFGVSRDPLGATGGTVYWVEVAPRQGVR